jgi:16S rRNA (guanine966-N2)-methyltransferase
VIAGELRHRQFLYDGDPSVRPMRDAVREALFNILGETVVDAVLWDAFAGTGAVGIEGISRGGHRAVFCERSRSVAAVLRQNLAALAIDPRATVIVGDTFLTLPPRMDAQRTAEPLRPWILFLCPPYAMFDEHPDPLRDLLRHARALAPPQSWVAIECDDRQAAETQLAPDLPWDTRQYGNTRLLIAPLHNEDQSSADVPATSSEDTAQRPPG